MKKHIREHQWRSSSTIIRCLKSRTVRFNRDNNHSNSICIILRKLDQKAADSAEPFKYIENTSIPNIRLPKLNQSTSLDSKKKLYHSVKGKTYFKRIHPNDCINQTLCVEVRSILEKSLGFIKDIKKVSMNEILKLRTLRMSSLTNKTIQKDEDSKHPKQILKDVKNTMSCPESHFSKKCSETEQLSDYGIENSWPELKKKQKLSHCEAPRAVKRSSILNPVVRLKRLKLRRSTDVYRRITFEEQISETSCVSDNERLNSIDVKDNASIDESSTETIAKKDCRNELQDKKCLNINYEKVILGEIKIVIPKIDLANNIPEIECDFDTTASFCDKDGEEKKKKHLNVSFKDHPEIIYDVSDDSDVQFIKNVRVSSRKITTRYQVRQMKAKALEFDSLKNRRCCRSKPVNYDESKSESGRQRKRMTKAEAQHKTDIVNSNRKSRERISHNLISSHGKNSQRPRKNAAKNIICVDLCDSSSSSSNESSNTLSPRKIHDRNEVRVLTPYVSLDRLSETDISSYKITPLREDRVPKKSKTEVDYGIDDVNTDDSTDDDEFPKKELPLWALEAKIISSMIYNIQRHVPRNMVRSWIFPPKHQCSLKAFLFK